ncbi:MAG: ferrous iron transport protein A [Thermosynechococcus sp. Uc]|uniref:FeoA family protein n=1 Tax=Thermosynechococcus sp. Uc TaxID=3034853 RepID=UPI0019FF384E|nr:ferrous iron transport protein A [Thermosynechococcus sp. Uc]MDM7326886.1 ferrous iron transport protein A [Thermosynechococcus sp. Uc]HIK24893.1 ferrous iron transport protein A [Thermosynechococcus sp. M46_R2017_013]
MSKLISLAEAKVGDRYTIAKLICSNTQQLLGMGLAPGAVISILHRSDSGSVMVGLDSQRFCLNHELAQHILLKAPELPVVNLRTAPVGTRLRIIGYAPTHPSYKRKLLAMGLTPGTEVEVIRHAPLGDPTDIKVRGFHLTLRKDEAEALKVSPL